MKIGDKILDCYMQGIGGLDHMGHEGVIEHIAYDYVVVRDLESNTPIFISTKREFELFKSIIGEDEIDLFMKSIKKTNQSAGFFGGQQENVLNELLKVAVDHFKKHK